MTRELPAKARVALLRQAVRAQPQSAVLLCQLSAALANTGEVRRSGQTIPPSLPFAAPYLHQSAGER